MMEKIFLALSIVFSILTFCGAGYVFYTGGQANAGFACVPMLAALMFSVAYQRRKNKK